MTNSQSGMMPGMRFKWPGTSAPPGSLKENGAAISRTAYAALFAVIGTTFGAGDGVTTFNLPDTRSEFDRNLDDGRGIDVGRTLGSSQSDELKNHNHQLYAGAIAPGTGNEYSTNRLGTSIPLDTLTGGAGGVETRPRNVAFLACIKY